MSTKYAHFHKTAFWAALAGLGSLGPGGVPGALAPGVHPRFVTLEALANAARKIRLHAN